MKYNLQISTDDGNELARIVAFLNGNAAALALVSVPPVVAAPVLAGPAPAFGNGGAPAPVVAAPVASTGPVELDSTGLPWDERIHASTKGKNADGTWRGRRGVDEATIAAVTQQLRAGAPVVQQPQPVAAAPVAFAPLPVAAQQPQPAPSPEQVFGAAGGAAGAPMFQAAPVAAAPAFQPTPVAAAPAFQPAPAPVVQQPQPAPAPVAAAPVAAAPDAPLPTLNFQQLMAAISQGLRDKKIDNTYLGQLVAHYQLPSIPALANTHAQLMPNVIAELRNKGVV